MKTVVVQAVVTEKLYQIIQKIHASGLCGLSEPETIERIICRGIADMTRSDGIISERLRKLVP